MSDTPLPPSAYALACAKRRDSLAEAVQLCAGGQHAMRRDSEGPPDRPFKCVRCPAERPWLGVGL